MPARSYGSKTPPHNTPTATGTPSSLDQTADLPAFPAHKGHRTGSHPPWAPHRAGKTPGRLREAWTQAYGPADERAEVSRDAKFSHHPLSSRLSRGRRHGSGYQKVVLSSLGSLKATTSSKGLLMFFGQPPKHTGAV